MYIIDLPEEAIYRPEKKNIKIQNNCMKREKLWFYESFEKGSHKNWQYNLFDCGTITDNEYSDINWNYHKYKMIFIEEKGRKMEFEFRHYEDPLLNGIFSIYLNGYSLSDYEPVCKDLAGCCRSALYYMCTRV